MIDEILNTLIPENKKINMPSASNIEFELYEAKYDIKNIVMHITNQINKLSIELFDKSFEELELEKKNKVIETVKLKDIKKFSIFIKHVFNAYYSNNKVLAQIDINTKKNLTKETKTYNWSILNSVKKRGKIYK